MLILPASSLLAPGPYQLPVAAGFTIDWSNPISRGLVAAYAPGVTGGVNLAGKSLDVGWPPKTGQNQEGPAFDMSAGGIGTDATPDILNAVQYSTFVRCYNSGTGAQFQWLTVTVNLGASPFNVFNLDVDTSVPNWVMKSNNAGSQLSQPTGVAPALGMQDITVTFDTTGVGTWALYTNGTLAFSANNGTIAPVFSPTPRVTFGNSFPTLANVGYAWTRTLTAAEVMALHLSPYALLIPAEYEMPIMFPPPPPPPGIGIQGLAWAEY